MKTIQVKLPIQRIAVSTNRNGRLSIVCASSKYNESGVFQLTEAHLDNIAENAMNCDAGTLADAVAYGNQMFEESNLVITFRFCKEGEPIGTNPDGTPIVSSEGSEVFTKDHWRTESYDGIELAESGVEFIKDLLKDLAKDRLKEKRAGKRTAPVKRVTAPKAPAETVEDESSLEDENEETPL